MNRQARMQAPGAERAAEETDSFPTAPHRMGRARGFIQLGLLLAILTGQWFAAFPVHATSSVNVKEPVIHGAVPGATLAARASKLVHASQSGDGQFLSATQGRSARGTGIAQTIAWTSPATNEVLIWNRAYPLRATSSSGLPVTFRLRSGPAFIADGMVTVTNSGTVVLAAEQAGDLHRAPVTQLRALNHPTYVGDRLGEWPGFPRGEALGVFVQGTRAYLALGTGGLAILDTSNPAAPVRLAGFATGGNAQAVELVGNLAYLADGSAGLQMIDVSNPAEPVRLGGFDSVGNALGVQVVGGQAYVAGGLGGLQVIDVSNPVTPARLGGFATRHWTYDVQIVGNLAYLADGGGRPSGDRREQPGRAPVPRKLRHQRTRSSGASGGQPCLRR